MKKKILGLAIGLGFLLMCGNLMAADGDLIVNGNIGVGKTPTVKLDVNGVVSVNSNLIKNVSDPVDSSDAATKGYVNNLFASSGGIRKRVFVTSTTYSGNLGGLAGADASCQTQAAAAGLGGTWKTILSDGSHDARDRIGYNWDYLVTKNGRIVVSVAELWRCTYDNLGAGQCLNSPINMDENGNIVSYPTRVWTGSALDGTKLSNNYMADCSAWSGTGSGSYGDVTYRDSGWINGTAPNAVTCTNTLHLYCIEQ